MDGWIEWNGMEWIGNSSTFIKQNPISLIYVVTNR